ncbi:hypothetical protein BRD56_08650 [Thermoplasmatales archaeon SW_10_69_26]|nr:MAG: hypothetical protein BRD56_08650 [Thermoplasmatales archaeon SW_10_69_26]
MVLVAASIPAVADRTTVNVQDEDALFVGDPSGVVDARVDQTLLGQDVDAGTFKAYEVPVEPASNRLEIDLRYNTGPVASTGPCPKANDLDLRIDGPGFERVYDGCDDGHVTLLAPDVPTGNYTVTVEAEQGSTICLPFALAPGCDHPQIEYRLDLVVWQVET